MAGDRDPLADAPAEFSGETGMQWTALAERLAARWPDRSACATAESASAELRALGRPLRPGQPGRRNLQAAAAPPSKPCRQAPVLWPADVPERAARLYPSGSWPGR